MALAEVYVDPSLASDSGTGTSGDPYGDLQYALTQTSVAGDGHRFNVKAGTAEILSADLNLAAGYTPAETSPKVIQGYASTAGDGDFQGYLADQSNPGTYGIGSIQIGANQIGDGGLNSSHVSFKHMEIYNKTSAGIALNLDNNNSIVECDIHDIDATWCHFDNYAWIIGCYIHDASSISATGQHNSFMFNYFENGTKDFSTVLVLGGSTFVHGNIFDLDGTSNAISLGQTLSPFNITGNTFLSSGTGNAINVNDGDYTAIISNNYIEGWNVGIGGGATAQAEPYFIYNNRFFNCTTDISTSLTTGSGMPSDMTGDNVGLTATGIAKSGAKSVENRLAYFAAVDTDSDMFGSGYEGYVTPGAVELASGGVAPTGVFNVSKGRVAELAKRVIDGDPANSELVLVLATGSATDATIQDYDTLATLLGDADVTEATFTNYARKYVTTGITQTPDDTNNRLDVDLPDQTWTTAGGASNNSLTRLFLCYGPDSASRSDATTIPLCYYDVSYTTDGSDLSISFDAQGAYSAS